MARNKIKNSNDDALCCESEYSFEAYHLKGLYMIFIEQSLLKGELKAIDK